MDLFFRVRDLPERELIPGVRYREVAQGEEMLLFVTLDQGARVPRHFHRHEQITYVVSGRVEFEVEGERRVLVAGEGVRIPPGAQHGERALLGPAVLLHGWSRHLEPHPEPPYQAPPAVH